MVFLPLGTRTTFNQKSLIAPTPHYKQFSSLTRPGNYLKTLAVETRVLNQAVGRNIKRFPKDFMFELTRDEIMRISQTVTSSQIKYSKRVHAFTEQGVAMLSSVLNSERAIEVNIAIMRAFVKLREMLGAHKDLRRKLAALERKYDDQFKIVFEAIADS